MLLLTAVLTLAGCSVARPVDRDAGVIVIGDSILAGHRGSGQSISNVVSQSTDLSIKNVAISGATFLGEQGIPTQFISGDWDWVIVDGGGNDLHSVCQTPGAQQVLDAIVSADGTTGAFPAFVKQVADQGSQVIVLGYYPVSDLGGPFAQCRVELSELAARQSRMAALIPSVVFVDTGKVVGSSDGAAYAPDLVHPSPRGAALIGHLIASEINRVTS
jgi:lysophospholipase L1-like esterase